jgi:DNA-binding CsgD family transcriptional regulator
MNRMASALLEADGEIQVVSDQFCFVDKARTSELREFLEAGQADAAGWTNLRAEGDVAVVLVEWLEAGSPEAADPLVSLSFCPAPLERRYVWADFAPYFSLTRSEAAIVRMLISGRTPTQVAAELNSSIETVRTHIRRTYNKLGISSREQLFSLVAPFRIG